MWAVTKYFTSKRLLVLPPIIGIGFNILVTSLFPYF
jgi:hypothetical protein